MLLRLDAVQALAAFYVVRGMLCATAVWLPHDESLRTGRIAIIGCLTLIIGLVLAIAHRVAERFCDALVAVGGLLMGVLVEAGRGGLTAVAFASYVVWVAVYAGSFFPARLAAAQFGFAAVAVVVGWSDSGRPWVPSRGRGMNVTR